MKRLREVYDKAVNDWGADHPGSVCVCVFVRE